MNEYFLMIFSTPITLCTLLFIAIRKLVDKKEEFKNNFLTMPVKVIYFTIIIDLCFLLFWLTCFYLIVSRKGELAFFMITNYYLGAFLIARVTLFGILSFINCAWRKKYFIDFTINVIAISLLFLWSLKFSKSFW